jgi:tripartite-type tricarboxylate transporter receptor subunit TctC
MKAAKILAVCLVALAGLSLPGRAQTKYPSRPITIIAPISPGTAIDILARLYAEKLSSKFAGRSLSKIARVPPVPSAANTCLVPLPTATP